MDGTLFFAASWLLVYVCCIFVLSVALKRNDIADVAWGMGYVTTCLFFMFRGGAEGLTMLVYVLVILWGVRLSTHIFVRNFGQRSHGEDFRYKKWRETWGRFFLARSFFQVYLLQGFFMFVVMAPVFVVTHTWGASLGTLGLIGVIMWVIGFLFESVGDYQLTQFINAAKKSGTKDSIMTSGLWKYSRHPNYFGEIMMWWGLFMMVMPLPHGLLAIISPITITVLLLFVSGIPLLEKRYEGNTAFETYKKKTSVLIPWFPRR